MLAVFFNCPSPYFFEMDLLPNLELVHWLVWLASNTKHSVSASSSWREQLPLCCVFYIGAGDPN